jgi:hypothetical protein
MYIFIIIPSTDEDESDTDIVLLGTAWGLRERTQGLECGLPKEYNISKSLSSNECVSL